MDDVRFRLIVRDSPPISASSFDGSKILTSKMEQRVSLDDRVHTVIRVIFVAIRFAFCEKKPAFFVSYALTENVP